MSMQCRCNALAVPESHSRVARVRGRLAGAAALVLLLTGCVTVDQGGPGGGPGPGGGGYYPAPPSPQPSPQPAPRPAPLPPAVPDIRVSPASPDFGPVEVGAAAFREVTVANVGGRGVRLREASVIGPGFDIERDGCAGRVLEPRRECGIRVRFVPVRRGKVSGALRIRGDGADALLFTAALEGDGRDRGVPDIRLGAKSLDFGAIALGQARSAEVRVTSAGGRELRVRSAKVEGRGFAVQADGCSGQSLGPGQGCTIAVRFAPAAAGAAQGRLEIVSDDPDERAAVVDLAGKGTERPRCPVVRLELGWDRGADPEPLVASGVLPPGECLTYALVVKRPGRLVVCVPPGYALTAAEFELLPKEECRVGDDPAPYLKYRRSGIEAGSEITDLTLTRRDDARRQFKVLLDFRTRREGRAPGREDD